MLILMPSPGATPSYSLVDQDRKILISVLLQGTCYTALTTSLLAQSELTVQQVEDALKNEEAHHVGAAASLALSSGSQTAAPVSGLSCTFCGRARHSVECCFKFEDYSKMAKEVVIKEASSGSKKCPCHKGKANAAQEALTPTESAGAASIHNSSSPSC